MLHGFDKVFCLRSWYLVSLFWTKTQNSIFFKLPKLVKSLDYLVKRWIVLSSSMPIQRKYVITTWKKFIFCSFPEEFLILTAIVQLFCSTILDSLNNKRRHEIINLENNRKLHRQTDTEKLDLTSFLYFIYKRLLILKETSPGSSILH